jgi:uncharacterized membrane protein YidH (DUF202 family)
METALAPPSSSGGSGGGSYGGGAGGAFSAAGHSSWASGVGGGDGGGGGALFPSHEPSWDSATPVPVTYTTANPTLLESLWIAVRSWLQSSLSSGKQAAVAGGTADGSAASGFVYDDEAKAFIALHLPLWKENWTKTEVVGTLLAALIVLVISVFLVLAIVAPVDCAKIKHHKECYQYAGPSTVLAESEVLILITSLLLFTGWYYQRRDRDMERPTSLMRQRVTVLVSFILVTYSVWSLVVLARLMVPPWYVGLHLFLYVCIWRLTT